VRFNGEAAAYWIPRFRGYDGKIQCTRKHQQLKPSYTGLTRVSIDLQQEHCSLGMDCRVKPGNDILMAFARKARRHREAVSVHGGLFEM
jgi:hypothetical protein